MATEKSALAAALDRQPFESEKEHDLILAAARERLAQLEDNEGKRLHGLIRSWNPDLNDYAVRQFAKQIMDTIGGTE